MVKNLTTNEVYYFNFIFNIVSRILMINSYYLPDPNPLFPISLVVHFLVFSNYVIFQIVMKFEDGLKIVKLRKLSL